MPPTLINAIRTLVLSYLCAFMAYFFIDNPTASWASQYLAGDFAINGFAKIPKVIAHTALIIYLICGIRYCYERYTHTDHVLFGVANSIAITIFLIQFLKPTLINPLNVWQNHNLLWAPHPIPKFHHFLAINSPVFYPAEHSGITAAATTILFIAYPQFRILIVFISSLAIMGLIGNNYFFVSEMITGGALGFIVANFIADITNIEHIKNETYVLG